MWIPEGTSQVNLKFTGPSVPQGAQMTFGVASALENSPVEVANKVASALLASELVKQCSPTLYLSSILVKMGPNEDGPMAEVAAQLQGGSDDPSVPPNVAVLVKKNTAMGGRMNQGRLYIPGCPESWVDFGGKLIPNGVTGYQVACDKLLDELTDLEVPMMLLHGTEHEGWFPLAVTSLSVQSTVATQRRRLR
jgi:hypothetical protein